MFKTLSFFSMWITSIMSVMEPKSWSLSMTCCAIFYLFLLICNHCRVHDISHETVDRFVLWIYSSMWCILTDKHVSFLTYQFFVRFVDLAASQCCYWWCTLFLCWCYKQFCYALLLFSNVCEISPTFSLVLWVCFVFCA